MNASAFQDAYLRRIETIIQPEEINILVANALRFIVQNVFAKMANTFVITLSSAEGPVEFWLNDLMSKLFISWSFMALQLIVLDDKIERLDVLGKRYCNLILIDSYKSLEKANIATYNKNSDGLEYIFIFLQISDHKA
ncbi:hypothetical protein CVS40_5203 [Lucilia cuprina]|nr:hypothetical protein CVS40_5203 [Lucilia cuprina]